MASVASVYGRAFADVVLDKRLESRQVLAELKALEELLQENGDLRRVWENPSIPAEQKRRLLDVLVAREGFSRPVRNFAAVLIDHQRIAYFESIVRQIGKELDDRLGFAEAHICSARELSAAERRMLESQVERLTGRKVRANYTRDVTLLGGAVVRVGSTIYDGSVRGQLMRIREQIVSDAG
jgi:F-type H+-transporting ATPase subunit delta